MSLYAIGDLHFSTAVNKPMNIFGDNWENHEKKIIDSWNSKVNKNDTVLIVGDTSWGINMDEATFDLDIIHNLPGEKIYVKGNHDYWWTTVAKLNKLYEDMSFLQNNFYSYNEYAICGTRGWICPNDVKFTEDDEKIYKREAHRLKLSLDAAKKAGFEKIIVITHYPPTNDKLEPSLFTDIYEEYKVEKVIYGHLHGKESFKMGLEGIREGVEYKLVSCDYVDFNLVKIMD
ncbi:phosphoesterase [[Clostridium] sordellii]|uniref:Phosphoesterase n=1 Tax=Paraclostridium sordellii TaxID=1505 RepID=A0ABM9RSN3_PARSO|nr:metallophosphoesterase [Paeniclostridium sordellii]MCH1967621.1 metallophosphoesterase [Paeniclostridium sordellii]RGX10769.1 serine/threonine protein phosphatase [Paeniclostridium sordellii]CEJ75081.1 putative phosphoesterase [[Clostridium] sordellii] [Paeniclostridium sordellii]CEK36127.1 phosphoesterase,Predicted phosphoesterase or phosphohydrolase,putative phosphoesterase,Calcineurin-like phosphoesterase [[Clostridium] sordellii] [Paeniclostridium sordellii]CEN70849.1 phosphoesterase [[